ncbi:MAG TPA: hypothetical protein PK819_02790 [Thermomicrobiales bacterium]|nr:hypothetical protein [Thermomicrobiales bacterium]
MTNRVRYYITENGDEAIVRSVPVAVSTQPQHALMSMEAKPEPTPKATEHNPVGRIVKVLRKPTTPSQP